MNAPVRHIVTVSEDEKGNAQFGASRGGINKGWDMTVATAVDEQTLVERLMGGDPDAIDDLVDVYKDRLFAFILRTVGNYALAEDVFQEMWIKVIRRIGTFRGDSKLSTWLFQVALNTARDAMRKKGRHTFVDIDEAAQLPSNDRVDVDGMARAEQVKLLIDSLPEKMREVVVLKYYHDLMDAEIAEIAGVPEGTVKSRLHRANGIMKERWQKRYA